MTVIWTPTALGQLDEIYYTIHSERDAATASKWFLKLEDAAAQLTDFPLLGPPIPENALITTFPAFTGLRQLVVAPYRIIYEATASACDILGVIRCSRLRLDIRGKQEIT